MVFGREFSEKLTHLMVATAICCATASATVVPAPTAIGLVEALLGGAALAHFVLKSAVCQGGCLGTALRPADGGRRRRLVGG